MSFVDKVEVNIQAGRGGDGALSFHHEKFRAKGGPDGGDGGDGGNVVVMASSNTNTLADYRYKKMVKAEDGHPGRESKKHGKNGEDLILRVPVGTIIQNSDGEVLADFIKDGQSQIIAQGGKGGYGNAHFVSSRRQAPRVAEKGESGENFMVTMELKMIADVGLVGLPNAGKSTLLSVVSNARPEIANYPFTTLEPHLGVVDIDGQSLLFADIPGLIEGASQGKGLGDEFLRHIERTSVLLHLIDAYNDDVVSAYKTIKGELADYEVDLSKRPQIVVLTKIEGLDQDQVDDEIRKLKKVAGKNTPVTAISSASRDGLTELLRLVAKTVETNKVKAAKKTKKELPIIGLKMADDDWQVIQTDEGFMILGAKIERFAERTRLEDFHGEQRLRDIMRKMGITDELERQGIEGGQKVSFGNPSVGSLEY